MGLVGIHFFPPKNKQASLCMCQTREKTQDSSCLLTHFIKKGKQNAKGSVRKRLGLAGTGCVSH